VVITEHALETSWAFEHSDPHKSSPGSRS